MSKTYWLLLGYSIYFNYSSTVVYTIVMTHEFETLLSSVKYLGKEDILETAYKKHKSLDTASYLVTLKDRRVLQQEISYLLYLLETGQRPLGILDEDFVKFKPLIESLVLKGEMEKEAMELFDL